MFSTIPVAFFCILTMLLALVVALPLIESSKLNQQNVPLAAPKQTPQIEARVRTEGVDKQQRSMAFTVYILSQQLSWKIESVTDLDGTQALLSPELQLAINRAHEVLCVGTASAEGNVALEEARAAKRALTLAARVRGVVRDPSRTRLFTLNAGQYQGPPNVDSASQRKAIIIATELHDKDVNLAEALRSGLLSKQHQYPIVYSLLRDYSRSDTWLKGLKLH